jgi:hypothetical protein
MKNLSFPNMSDEKDFFTGRKIRRMLQQSVRRISTNQQLNHIVLFPCLYKSPIQQSRDHFLYEADTQHKRQNQLVGT